MSIEELRYRDELPKRLFQRKLDIMVYKMYDDGTITIPSLKEYLYSSTSDLCYYDRDKFTPIPEGFRWDNP